MLELEANLQAVRRRIRAAELASGRPEGSVRLLAVSKTQPAGVLREAYGFGQREFGENYLQEAAEKQDSLADLDIVWHFIGPIQSNKTRPIAERFDWVHGIDRLKIAQRLSDQRPEEMAPLNVCIQVNLGGEATKSGVAPGGLADLAHAVAALPRLRLRGLMAIPAPTGDVREQRAVFRRMRELLAGLSMPELDTLSMGMSNDLEAAVAEGATLVRIGTAIFGRRPSART
ncbi:YggS family pyridoxal phosphate-dependent enzyme [Methylococcus geothermalis]|uniref:Pyridoxal phosphate homeostasis protein n=1 Tax=Methylococcus geothermalis TaxID=2681310 RepID=A0A858Q7S4_9GAMM|nr:YggS family pyridoxal phosphate-dependent enzyme [Methylococcus geothermalis]QJD29861.1 YggS family pyridoxal phosphate-dependent enzyme [Methylococcus geothermalis]